VLVGASLLVILGTLELLFRKLDFPFFDGCFVRQHESWREDPELGFGYVPGSEVRGARINARGLRGPLLAERKPADTVRILFVGDSTCFGLGVGLDESFPAVATRLLQAEDPARHYEFVIGALPGYSSYQSRVLLERLLPLEPDLVVFYVGAYHDHADASYYHDRDIPRRMARRHAAWHQVHILNAAESLWDLSGGRWIRGLLPERTRARVTPEDFRRNLDDMLIRSREAGARMLLLLPPHADRLLARRASLPLYQAALREAAEAHAVASLPLQPVFQPFLPVELYLLPEDDSHASPLGHRLIGESIFLRVRDGGILGAAS
jgi:lysophospholipase L1-like esterase